MSTTVGWLESKSLPPVAAKACTPFTVRSIALALLRGAKREGEIVDDVGAGFDADRQPHQLLADPRGFQLGRIHLLMRGAGGVNDQRLGVADIGEMADHPELL